MFHSRYTDWVCKGKFLPSAVADCAVWDIVYNERQVLLPCRKAIFSLPCTGNGPADANQDWHSAVLLWKPGKQHTKLEVWDVYLMGLDVEQVRNYWAEFSVNAIRTQCERAFVGRSKRTNLHIKSCHCNFFTVHTIICPFLFRMKQEITAAETTF